VYVYTLFILIVIVQKLDVRNKICISYTCVLVLVTKKHLVCHLPSAIMIDYR